MRLIEVDKAIEATWEQPIYTDPLNVLTEVRDRIRELPTVEAIPVEWIEEWMGYQCSWDIQGVKSLLGDWGYRKEK